jgi:hypothetical protein
MAQSPGSKRIVAVRLAPDLYADVLNYAGNVSQAVEGALRDWVRKQRRRKRRYLPAPTDRRTIGGRKAQ